MAALDQVVKIDISNQTAAVPQAGFGVPLIVGPTAPGWADAVRAYSAPGDLLADGYTSSSPEYLYAVALYSQAISPAQYLVGRRSAAVAQVDTFAVGTLTVGRQYKVTVNGSVYSYTAAGGDTQQAVLSALGSAIAAAQPVSSSVSGTGGSASLTLTASSAGASVAYTALDAQLTRTGGTAASGIAQDLAAISLTNDTWYGLVLAGGSDADVLQAAAYIESVKKVYLAVSGTAAIGTSSTTDVLSTLKGKKYARTALLFGANAVSQAGDAAWLGGQLPQVPGSTAWAYKSLAGVSPDALTANQVATVVGIPLSSTPGKNGNVYTVVGGVPVTQQGVATGGQYLDITIGLDWLQATMQAAVYGALTQAQKVPYTDAGVAVLMSALRSVIDQGVVNGLIDGTSAISVSAPLVAAVPQNQRASRVAPTISFGCRLQGAVQAVRVAGVVTV